MDCLDTCPGYLDYPFQIKRFGHGSVALPHLLNTVRSSQNPLFSERMIQVARTGFHFPAM